MQLVGSQPAVEVKGLDPLPGKANYFIGNDPKKWRTDVRTYGKVQYRDVYPGVDLVYHGSQQQLEYDFVVAPGADPTAIRIGFLGTEATRIDENGDLVMHIGGTDIHQRKPLIYQEIGGARRELAGGYVLKGSQVGFEVAAYDASRSLVIDPVLVYSTFLGGSEIDEGAGITVDDLGSVYVTGLTLSSNFPTLGDPFSTRCGLVDAYMAKLDPSGSSLVYSTYVGGCGRDGGTNVAVDPWHNVYIAGWTDSTDFPTLGGIQPSSGGGTDAFLVKLDSVGSAIYSTYLGGSGTDNGIGVAVDAEGQALLCGDTASTDFPIVSALQPALAGGRSDAFIAKLNATGSALVYSTYLGGSDYDGAMSIAIDAAGTAYVTGGTTSTNFPTVGALQPTLAGFGDAFVAAVNEAGSALVFSTYLGGSGLQPDLGAAIAVDGSGNAYVVGDTGSVDFPTMHALQAAFGGGDSDSFVAKLSANGALVYSTFLGGSDFDVGRGVAVDEAGKAYVSGETRSPDFPIVRPLQAALRGRVDAFVAKVDTAGSRLLYSTYLGGSGVHDNALRMAIDGAGNAYVTGGTFSADFPTAHPLQPVLAGVEDSFIAKIADPPCPEEVTDQVEVVRSRFHRILFTPFRFQWVVIRSKTMDPIQGPLAYVMEDLHNATFLGSRLKTVCFSPSGDPFIVIHPGSDDVLSPDERVLAFLLFFKTTLDIAYRPRVLSASHPIAATDYSAPFARACTSGSRTSAMNLASNGEPLADPSAR